MEQRVIKFRAWNDYPELEEPYMMSWKDLDKAYNDGIFLLFDILSGKEKSIIPMQYTGLKDKNGKEIYEGDIVKCPEATEPEDKGFICEFKTFRWKFFNIRFPDDDFYSIVNYYYINDRMEVIGNIYENIELLK